MFTNIGGKIKGVAKILAWVGIIVFVIAGIATGISSESFVVGLLIAAGGSLLSWVSAFTTYGFGQLVENSDAIREMMEKNAKGE